ncbi:hypothetical protein PHLCEN_2v11348 [Hermanssonia centrifuga]|uniref:Uncharacterized protein n=1 Tax=Hermanssonia centrifuga TaxID=98765 RepID=A0A2R6NK74_9APHY|nr:hypothetical protein PHLCEN_2v11348 [Hermanssonia centrifuga]
MSCVMGNRLCLNVRGMIWQDGRGSSYHESGLGPITPQSFRDRSRPWPIVIEGHRHERSAQLTEYEMHELRVMSASVQPK